MTAPMLLLGVHEQSALGRRDPFGTVRRVLQAQHNLDAALGCRKNNGLYIYMVFNFQPPRTNKQQKRSPQSAYNYVLTCQ